jgi:hypothetical protein
LLLLLHHAGLLLGGQVLLRPLARGRLHVAQVLPHGGGPSWVAHGTRVPLLGGSRRGPGAQQLRQLLVFGHRVLAPSAGARTPSARAQSKAHPSNPRTKTPGAPSHTGVQLVDVPAIDQPQLRGTDELVW